MASDPPWPRGSHVFVDESKSRDYTLVAAIAVPNDLAAARSGVSRLRHKGSSSIHMTKESPGTRKRILAGLGGLPVSAYVVQCANPGLSELERRFTCLEHLLERCDEASVASLTIELDESIRKHEEQFLLEARRRMSLSDEFRYHWRRRNEEPLLWVADAVAWSYVQGGDWRNRARPLLREAFRI